MPGRRGSCAFHPVPERNEAYFHRGIGVGTALACSYALSHPEQVEAMALMDFVWKVLLVPMPVQVKEMLLSLPNGYLQLNSVASLFDSMLFQFIAPDVFEWIHSTFPEAPVGPFLATFEPLPLVRGTENVEASVMIIRGTMAEVTSEADSLDFLSNIKVPIRVFNAIQGAGPVPHLEDPYYKRAFEDIAWFFSR